MGIMAQVWCSSKPSQPSQSDRGRVCVSVQLQGGTNEKIDSILSRQLGKNTIRTQTAIPAGKKEVRARCHILFHPKLPAETVNALNPPALDRRYQGRMRI